MYPAEPDYEGIGGVETFEGTVDKYEKQGGEQMNRLVVYENMKSCWPKVTITPNHCHVAPIRFDKFKIE